MQVTKEAPRRIRGTLMVKGRSARWLATECGFRSHSYINRILSGEVRTVTPETAALIAATLEVPMDDLFLPRVASISGGLTQKKAS